MSDWVDKLRIPKMNRYFTIFVFKLNTLYNVGLIEWFNNLGTLKITRGFAE